MSCLPSKAVSSAKVPLSDRTPMTGIEAGSEDARFRIIFKCLHTPSLSKVGRRYKRMVISRISTFKLSCRTTSNKYLVSSISSYNLQFFVWTWSTTSTLHSWTCASNGQYIWITSRIDDLARQLVMLTNPIHKQFVYEYKLLGECKIKITSVKYEPTFLYTDKQKLESLFTYNILIVSLMKKPPNKGGLILSLVTPRRIELRFPP